MDTKKDTRNGIMILLTLSAAYVYMLSCGIRNNFGIMLSGIIENTGMAFASVSFVLAVAQLCFGMTQPFFGVLAKKRGNRFALLTGICCITAGILLLPFCKSLLTLMLVLGILLPGGLGAMGFSLVMGTISPRLTERQSTLVSGVVNGASGIGNTLLSPVISMTIVAGGLLYGMKVLAVLTVLMIPVTILMCGRDGRKTVREETKTEKEKSIREMFRAAFHSRDYIFIMLGFFTCGFHMAIITNHLPTEILSYGYADEQTAFAFSIYGIATILGCLASGAACSRWKRKNVLGSLYGSRTVMVLLFLILPKTMPVICGYIILLGLTGSATLTPVLGICERLFGVSGAAIFFSFAFFIHQIGGFVSAWAAGVCFETFGGYHVIWLADAVVAFLAATVSYLIQEKRFMQEAKMA